MPALQPHHLILALAAVALSYLWDRWRERRR
jgi:hypothetical protein